MENDYIDLIQATPKLHSKKCKVLAFVIQMLLQYTTITAGLVAWLIYDYFIGGAVLLLAFIVMGIIRSKLRNSAIPASQREYHYNDKGIAEWFVSQELCPDD